MFTFMESLTSDNNFANSLAPFSSKRGIVMDYRGATRDFEQRNCVVNLFSNPWISIRLASDDITRRGNSSLFK